MRPGDFRSRPHSNSAVVKAVQILGGAMATAKAFGISQPAVMKWVYNGIPPMRAIELEKLSGVPREQMLPELFKR